MANRPSEWKHERLSVDGLAVVVTGGSTGIGRATARLLASEGARVLVFARREKELEDALEDIRRDGRAIGLVADQARVEDVRRAEGSARPPC